MHAWAHLEVKVSHWLINFILMNLSIILPFKSCLCIQRRSPSQFFTQHTILGKTGKVWGKATVTVYMQNKSVRQQRETEKDWDLKLSSCNQVL